MKRGSRGQRTDTERSTHDRGQSELIGIVLLVGLTATVATFVLVAAGPVVEESQQQAREARIENGFLELDERIDAVAYGEADNRAIDLELPSDGDGRIRRFERSRFVVTITDSSGATEVVNRSVRSIVYKNGETTVAYESTAVWRGTGNRTQILSVPGMEYNVGEDPTLTMPISRVQGPGSLTAGELSIEKKRTVAPLNNVSIVDDKLVTIRVTSPYYVGWANYFRTLTGGVGVSVDHANRTAVLRLVTPLTGPGGGSAAGVVSTGLSTDMQVEKGAVVDSYTSADGDGYAGDTHDQGKIIAYDEVVIKSDATVNGDIETNESFKLETNGEVKGNVSYGPDPGDTKTVESGATIQGWIDDNGSVPAFPPVDGLIDNKRLKFKTSNDNGSAPAISGGDLSGCSTACTLTAGDYYVSKIDVNDYGKLVFDTSGGPIEIAVAGDISIGNDANITVLGDGSVKIYNEGTLYVQEKTNWHVPNKNASQFWIYMNPDPPGTVGPHAEDADLKEDITFVGVIYGAGNATADGTEISPTENGAIYGAVVGEIDKVQDNHNIHFDRSLGGEGIFSGSSSKGSLPEITYFHLSLHEVNVTERD